MMKIDHEYINRLAEELRRPRETLYALAPCNDPFSLAPWRVKMAEWFAELWDRFNFGRGTHLRKIHYILISQPLPVPMWHGTPYENSLECWQKLVDASKNARNLRLVSPALFVDRRSEKPILAVIEAESEGFVFVGDGKPISLDTHDWSLPAPPRLLLRPKVNQRYLIEIWVEKSTMQEVLIPLHRQFGVNIVTGVGELSDTRCQQLVDRALTDGRPVRILYVSDFDPGGQSMPVAVARKIEHRIRTDGLDLDVQLRHIVLDVQQCRQYRLPRTPIKESERRKARFEERFGEGATELDALEALHPGELRRILVREISRYYDRGLDRRLSDVEAQFRIALDDINARAVAEHASELAALSASYEQIMRRHSDELRGIAERFSAVQRMIQDRIEDEAPDVDDYEWPEPEDGDEDPDPLYDATRDYVEQVDRYKRHQGKPTTGVYRSPMKRRKADGNGAAPE